MPNFDRLGPLGEGPMTGKMRGLCAGGGQARGRSLGWRGGRGFGRGRGWRFRGEDLVFDRQEFMEEADDPRVLKAERNRLKAMLSRTEDRLRALANDAGATEQDAPPTKGRNPLPGIED